MTTIATVGIVAKVGEQLISSILEVLRTLLSYGTKSLVRTYTISSIDVSALDIWVDQFKDNVVWRNHVFGKTSNLNDQAFYLAAGTKMLIRYQGWWLWVQYEDVGDEKDVKKMMSRGADPESVVRSVTVSTLLKSHDFMAPFWSDLKEIQDNFRMYSSTEDHLYVRTANEDYWNGRPISPRSVDSVFLPEDTKNRILGTINEFIEAMPWYEELHIPHRLGILLEGPPGNGKTSIAQALASHFDSELYILPLGSPSIDDDSLISLVQEISGGAQGAPAFVLIEDISALSLGQQVKFKNEDGDDVERERISLSGLLNAIDGVMSPNHVIFLFTANVADNLDEALVRHGRIDVKIHIGNATKEQADGIFGRFFPEHDDARKSFVEAFPEGKHNMAEVQFVLAQARKDPWNAVIWARESREGRLGPVSVSPPPMKKKKKKKKPEVAGLMPRDI
ncbi:MAG: AAA family ATPase [Cyclobacteriaceae bacterium]|nr:AAA family ATPase [Cyclobacteriaceae bacterium]